MDKRAFLAVTLSLAVLVLWQIFFGPRLAPPPPTPSAQSMPAGASAADRIKAGTDGSVPVGAAGTVGSMPGNPAETAAQGHAGAGAHGMDAMPRRESPEGAAPVVIETQLARIEIDRTGGKVRSWTLKNYRDHEGRPYELVAPDSARSGEYPLQLRLADKALEGLLNRRVRFDVERHTAASSGVPGASTGKPLDAGSAGDPSASAGAAASAANTGSGPHAGSAGGAAKAAGAGSAGAAASAANAGSGPAGSSGVAAKAGQPRAQEADGSEEIRLVYSDGQGLVAIKSLTFRQDSYLFDITASVTRSGEPVPGQLVWGPGIGTPNGDDLANKYYEGGRAIADFESGARRFSASRMKGLQKLEGGLRWAGLEEQYFAAVFMPAVGLEGTEVFPLDVPHAPPVQGALPAGDKAATLPKRVVAAVPLQQPYTLFVGPKDYQILSSLNRGLTDLVNFAPGTPLIGPLVGVLAQGLWHVLRWLHSFLPNYGLAIIILTAAIKILFYPLTQRAMVKMRTEQKKMLRVQPKINAIKEKHRKAKDASSKAKMNEDLMALYKREGINPMASLGGCLPLLLQLPILYGFYSVLTVSIELRQAPFFGWILDLSRPDRLPLMPGYWIPVTPILMGVSMFVQQKMAMTNVTDPQQKAQQRIMLIMPLIFTWTFIAMPSGLVLYWFVNNMLGIVQQVLINRQARALEAEGVTAAGKA